MFTNLILSAKWYPFLFDKSDKMDFSRTIAFWLTIAFAVIIAVTVTVLVMRFKGEKRSKLLKIPFAATIVYSCALIVYFLTLTFSESEIIKLLFVPLLILILVVAGFSVAFCFTRKKPVVIAFIACSLISLLAVLGCMLKYYISGSAEEYNWVSITKIENVGLYLSTFIVIAIIALVAYFVGKNDVKGFDTKSISYAACCIAMSFALSYVRIVKLPQGGSVTIASLLPLMIYSYMFGVRKGLFAGFVYGLLQAIQDPYIVHPMQFLLDYPIAFASIGIAGCFAKLQSLDKLPQVQFALGGLVAGSARFWCHVLSGVFAFSEYAYSASGEPMNALLYSLTYNSFVFVDIAITIFVGVFIFSSKSLIRQFKKHNNNTVNG